MKPLAFAHRGGRAGAAENTLDAFRLALKGGVDGLETDAWVSVDGEVVLVHDPVVWRGVRRLRVPATTAAVLGDLGIPRLADLYGELGHRYELSVDVKDPGAADAVLAEAERVGGTARLWLCSGRVELLRDLRARSAIVHLVHSTARSQVKGTLERHAMALAEARIDAVNLRHTEWTKGLVALFHRFDVLAFSWDVQETRDVHAAVAMGVDAVYSDHVGRVVAALADAGNDT